MKPGTRLDYEKRIARVVALIEADPSASWRLGDLAREANFSAFHFHRVYRAMRGETVAETIRLARLRRAAFELASSRRKVIDIALAAGFENPKSFARAFREFVTVSPTMFRRGGRTFADYVRGKLPGASPESEAMKVDLVELAPAQAVAIRHCGHMSQIPEVWSRLWRQAVEQGFADRIDYAVGVCADAPDEKGALNYCAALVLNGGEARGVDLEKITVPGGLYASLRHTGPYTGVAGAFGRLYGEWLPSSGREPDDRPSLEIYRNNPYDTPASALVTDLLLPVKA